MAQTAGLDFLPENLLAKLNCGIGLARPFDMKNLSNINFASCIERSVHWIVYISFALASFDVSSGSKKTVPRQPREVRLLLIIYVVVVECLPLAGGLAGDFVGGTPPPAGAPDEDFGPVTRGQSFPVA